MDSNQDYRQKPDFKDVQLGPLDENARQFRDLFCCLFFLLNLLAMIYCSIHGYIYGDPSKIYRSVAINQTVCGQGETISYPYLYIFNPFQDKSNRYCLKSCPYFDSNNNLVAPQCYPGHGSSPSCATFTNSINSQGSFISAPTSYTGIYIGYSTTKVLGRVCLPNTAALNNALSSNLSSLTNSLQQLSFLNLGGDTLNNWAWILAAVAVAFLLVVFMLVLMKFFVGCVIWTFVVGVIVCFSGFGVLFLYNAGIGIFSGSSGYLGMPTLSGSVTNTQYYQIYGYICFGFSALMLVLLLCYRSKIRLTVASCRTVNQYLGDVPQIYLVTVLLGLLLIGMWACCLLSMIYLFSSATFQVASDKAYFTSIQNYGQHPLILLYYLIFGTIWCSSVIKSIGIFTIASSCCVWYFNRGANSQLDYPVTRGLKYAFRFHFGSLVFGSLILAITNFLEYLIETLKKGIQSNTGHCYQYVINCLTCCLSCVQRLVQCFNQTAYVQIALRGKNFCASAWDGFQIIFDNGMRFLVLSGVGKIFIFNGALFIAVITTTAFYCLITFETSIKSNIMEPVYLLGVVFIISYFFAAIIFSVYSVAVDSILTCFVVDQMNQTSKGSKVALYGPLQFNQIMSQLTQQQNSSKKRQDYKKKENRVIDHNISYISSSSRKQILQTTQNNLSSSRKEGKYEKEKEKTGNSKVLKTERNQSKYLNLKSIQQDNRDENATQKAGNNKYKVQREDDLDEIEVNGKNKIKTQKVQKKQKIEEKKYNEKLSYNHFQQKDVEIENKPKNRQELNKQNQVQQRIKNDQTKNIKSKQNQQKNDEKNKIQQQKTKQKQQQRERQNEKQREKERQKQKQQEVKNEKQRQKENQKQREKEKERQKEQEKEREKEREKAREEAQELEKRQMKNGRYTQQQNLPIKAEKQSQQKQEMPKKTQKNEKRQQNIPKKYSEQKERQNQSDNIRNKYNKVRDQQPTIKQTEQYSPPNRMKDSQQNIDESQPYRLPKRRQNQSVAIPKVNPSWSRNPDDSQSYEKYAQEHLPEKLRQGNNREQEDLLSRGQTNQKYESSPKYQSSIRSPRKKSPVRPKVPPQEHKNSYEYKPSIYSDIRNDAERPRQNYSEGPRIHKSLERSPKKERKWDFLQFYERQLQLLEKRRQTYQKGRMKQMEEWKFQPSVSKQKSPRRAPVQEHDYEIGQYYSDLKRYNERLYRHNV